MSICCGCGVPDIVYKKKDKVEEIYNLLSRSTGNCKFLISECDFGVNNTYLDSTWGIFNYLRGGVVQASVIKNNIQTKVEKDAEYKPEFTFGILKCLTGERNSAKKILEKISEDRDYAREIITKGILYFLLGDKEKAKEERDYVLNNFVFNQQLIEEERLIEDASLLGDLIPGMSRRPYLPSDVNAMLGTLEFILGDKEMAKRREYAIANNIGFDEKGFVHSGIGLDRSLIDLESSSTFGILLFANKLKR